MSGFLTDYCRPSRALTEALWLELAERFTLAGGGHGSRGLFLRTGSQAVAIRGFLAWLLLGFDPL
jgi:hypothetical protein